MSRGAAIICVVLFSCFATGISYGQRDRQAIAIVAQAYKALGGAVPLDSRAIGNYDRIVGSSEDSGTLEIDTRGTSQTAERIINAEGVIQTVYSRGYASQKDATGVHYFTLEKSLGSNSVVFPLPILASVMLDPASIARFVGSEPVSGKLANHIQVCPARPDQNFSDISSFGTKDIWVAADSGLPLKVSYQVAEEEAGIPVVILYSNYQFSEGVAYPFHISISRNGTPYMEITMASAAFNVGLSEQDFSLK